MSASGTQGMAWTSLCFTGWNLGMRASVPRDVVLFLTSLHILMFYNWPQNIFSTYSWQCPCQYTLERGKTTLECMHAQLFNRVWLFATPQTIAHQAPLSVGFSWQEYWSELPFHSPKVLPDPGIEPMSPASPALAGRLFTSEPPGKPNTTLRCGQ